MTLRFHQSYASYFLDPDKCPADLKHRLDNPELYPATKAMDTGTIVHKLVLGGSTKLHVVSAVYDAKHKTKPGEPVEDYRTKAAAAERDEAYSKGMIPVLPREMDNLKSLASGIKQQLLEANYDVTKATNEKTLQWVSPQGVECEGTPDSFILDGPLCTELDLKVGEFVTNRKIWDFCYDVQAAAYEQARNYIRRRVDPAAQDADFSHTIAHVSLSGRRRVRFIPLSSAFMELGRMRLAYAQDAWAKCLKTGEWPECQVVPAEPDPWMYTRMEELLCRSN